MKSLDSKGEEILVICFSLTGNTRLVSRAIAKEAGADFAEIVPKVHYPLRGVWLYLRGGAEAISKAEPPIEEGIIRYGDYQLLVVGTPVWAGTMAPPVRTFLKSKAVLGKKLYLFCTYAGGIGSCLREMREIARGEVLGERGFPMGRKAVAESIAMAKAFGGKLRLE